MTDTRSSDDREHSAAHDIRDVAPFMGVATFMRAPHEPEFERTEIALVGVPYDGGDTFRGGARHGPRGVRDASTMLRPFHPVYRIDPYALCAVADVGDVIFNRSLDPVGAADDITSFFAHLQQRHITPIACGGDHSIPYPILRALGPGHPVGLVQFDSHCDVWDEYQGTRYHNGSWVRWCIEDGLVDPHRTIQVGIRGQQTDLAGWDWARDAGIHVLMIDELDERGPAGIVEEVRQTIGDGSAYVSFDVDVLDPVYARGTDTPEPGGMTPREAIQLVRGLRGANLIGADVVEVAPLLDLSGNTAHVAATVMYELLCILAERNAASPAHP